MHPFLKVCYAVGYVPTYVAIGLVFAPIDIIERAVEACKMNLQRIDETVKMIEAEQKNDALFDVIKPGDMQYERQN